MGKNKWQDRELILLEQESPSALKWLMVGAALGAGLALLLAPGSGEETRHRLVRQARKIRRAAEETVEDLQDRIETFRSGEDTAEEVGAGEEDESGLSDELEAEPIVPAAPPRRKRGDSLSAAREELERRLAAARARRKDAAVEDEEPVA